MGDKAQGQWNKSPNPGIAVACKGWTEFWVSKESFSCLPTSYSFHGLCDLDLDGVPWAACLLWPKGLF